MSKAHDTLIEFMRMKASFLPVPFNTEYFLPADEAAIREWDNEEANETLTILQEKFMFFGPFTCDESLCVFCIKNRMACWICEYAKLHGRCTITGITTYSSLLMALNNVSIKDYLTRQQHEALADTVGVEMPPTFADPAEED
jgi:hypothetical protein